MIRHLKNEIHIFFTALMFFTRIPCPKWVNYSETYLEKASRYFPLMGWIIGGIAALVFCAARFVLPVPLAVILSMGASILATGAFHEDGFADVCDGFGGGWTQAKILEIMKDSRIGSYGAIGIVLMLLTKFLTLSTVNLNILPLVMIAGHSLSRLSATTFMFTHQYARANEDSKAKPVAKHISLKDLLLASFFGLAPLLLLKNPLFFLLIIPVYISKWLLGRYFKKWIGGYTGDCLGATQQVGELIFYLSVIVICRFI
jgi:adenosylcobinamide-GDP ribazoletransferase